jgi:eukaryotic-like serine/threonine-protein kinase
VAVCPKCQRSYAEGVTTCPHDGEVLRPELVAVDRDLKRGETIGEYVIEGKIGSGTFGDVYRAIQPLIGKQVAIKLLSRRYSVDPNIVSRFIAEARAVNQIRHKNIIDIFSFGQLPDGRHYHIMELLEGMTLEDHLKAKGRLPPAEVILIQRALGKALDAAHAAGIAHRDLKPANVFLSRDEDGRPFPKLLDFGIAKLLSDDVPRLHQTATGAAVGTPDYMSPEQCQGPDVDHRTDVYAFGVMTYQLLTGQLPFVGANVVEVLVKQMTAKPAPPSKIAADLPLSFDAPVLWMLEKDKTKRPQNLATAIRGLEDAAREAGVSVPLTSTTGDPAATPPLGRLPQLGAEPVPNALDRAEDESATTLKSARTPVPPSASGIDDAPFAETVGASKAAAAKKRLMLAFAVFGLLAGFPLASYFMKSEKEPIAKAEPKVEHPATMPDPKEAPAPVPAPPEAKPTEKVEAPPAHAEPQTISLVVRTPQRGVEIFGPGGILLGKAPCTVRVARGTEPVKLEFRAPGHLTETKELVPIADGEVDIALRKKPANDKAKASSKKKPSSDDIENPFADP